MTANGIPETLQPSESRAELRTGPSSALCIEVGAVPEYDGNDKAYQDAPDDSIKLGKSRAQTYSLAVLETKFVKMLVLEDFRKPMVWRASVVEMIGTFVLLFVGVTATITSLEAGFTSPVMAIAIFQGLILSLCILGGAHASGGHVNPTITFAEMLTGHISPVRCLLYIVSQSLGSIAGSWAVKDLVGDTLAAKYLMGGCYLRSQTSATSGITGLEVGPALISEIFFTFFVLYIAYAMALHPPQLPRTGYILAPFMIGAVVALCIFSSGGLITGYGGAGINPARCIGPATVLGGSMWTGHWVFWVGPVVSCVALALLYWTIPPDHVEMYKKRNVKLGLSRSVRRLNTYGTKLGQYGRGYFNVGSVRRGGPSKTDHVCKLEEVARGRGFGMGESELHVREIDTSHLEVAL